MILEETEPPSVKNLVEHVFISILSPQSGIFTRHRLRSTFAPPDGPDLTETEITVGSSTPAPDSNSLYKEEIIRRLVFCSLFLLLIHIKRVPLENHSTLFLL